MAEVEVASDAKNLGHCGPAALATIARHHRVPIGVQRMRHLSGTDRVGTNLHARRGVDSFLEGELNRLYGYVRLRLSSEPGAEDVTQEVAVTFCRYAAKHPDVLDSPDRACAVLSAG
jgi:hypothetical protein